MFPGLKTGASQLLRTLWAPSASGAVCALCSRGSFVVPRPAKIVARCCAVVAEQSARVDVIGPRRCWSNCRDEQNCADEDQCANDELFSHRFLQSAASFALLVMRRPRLRRKGRGLPICWSLPRRHCWFW